MKRFQDRNKLTIDLEIDAVEFLGMESEEGKFRVIATATTKRGGRPVKEEIKFSLLTWEYEPVETDEDGSYTVTMSLSTKALGVLVKVKTTGEFPIKRVRFQKLPWPEIKKPQTEEEKLITKTKNEIELARAKKELKTLSQAEKEPSELEKKVAEIKLRADMLEAEQRISKATQMPDKKLTDVQNKLEIARLKTQLKEATKKEPPKKPAEIIPHVCGIDGNYEVTWEVLAADKSPIPGIVLTISDPSATERCTKLSPTNKNGMIGQIVIFSSREKILTASAKGGVSVWINLFNHKKEAANGC